LPPFDVEEYGIYAPALSEEVGTIASDVSPSYALTEIVSLTVKGSDPWLGAPTATLTDDQGMPIRTAAGRSIDSNGYGFWVDLVPQPGYRASPSATSRTFLWTFSMPAAQTVPGLLPEVSGGPYRLRVSIPTAGESVAVSSSAFTIGN
jgi:hypothetical protein